MDGKTRGKKRVRLLLPWHEKHRPFSLIYGLFFLFVLISS